jgi:hypothetical protein
MLRRLLLFTLVCTCGPASSSLSAQLQLTVDGGFAIATFDKNPVLPAETRAVFELDDNDTEKIEPLEGGYVGLGLAYQPIDKAWGWSTRLQYMKRGYRYRVERNTPTSFQRINRAFSYTTFIDLMAQATTRISGKLKLNAGPYFSMATNDYKSFRLNLNDPDNAPNTRTDFGINAGLSYPFGRLSIMVNYQQSLRRYDFTSLNEAYIQASGLADAVVLDKTPRISALRLGLAYAIWE